MVRALDCGSSRCQFDSGQSPINNKIMEKEEYEAEMSKLKKTIMSQVQCTIETPTITGGQSCGVMPRTVVVKHPDLSLEIKVGYFRSQFQNKEFALMLFELALDDLL